MKYPGTVGRNRVYLGTGGLNNVLYPKRAFTVITTDCSTGALGRELTSEALPGECNALQGLGVSLRNAGLSTLSHVSADRLRPTV